MGISSWTQANEILLEPEDLSSSDLFTNGTGAKLLRCMGVLVVVRRASIGYSTSSDCFELKKFSMISNESFFFLNSERPVALENIKSALLPCFRQFSRYSKYWQCQLSLLINLFVTRFLAGTFEYLRPSSKGTEYLGGIYNSTEVWNGRYWHCNFVLGKCWELWW